ncbi:MAG TPA: extracellular solute-binding protein [Methylomirabilota bacterium]|jgi:putative spermidine/putrescine transport system substrate-binding protein|nr:extracellular solute-binding protein [Methylomirabilota bacterium]
MSTLTRREFVAGSLALGAAALGTGAARAQTKNLVVATFPGTWSEAHRDLLAPYFRNRTGASVTQSIILAQDQIARLVAARGSRAPFDVAILDDPQVLDAAKQELIVEYPAAKSPNWKDLLPQYQDRWGPKISMQLIGIGYNPKKITTPPRSWDELWQPKYKGRVGLTALNSQLGIAFLVELNRLKGGTDTNFEPAFKALREVLPNVGAIGANLGAYATLWQQEQIDIAPYNFNFVQTLKSKGVPVELAIPDTGPVGWRTSLHLVKNAVEPDLAVAYVDSHLAADLQSQMLKPPFDVIPTNSKVALAGPILSLARTHADLAKIRTIDWEKINPQRSALIERFNREIKM